MEIEGKAQGVQGDQEVAEEDGRVEPEGADGLQRHLDRELGGAAQLEQRVALSKGAVLGHVSAGLSHEPHRRGVHWLPPTGAEETVVHWSTLVIDVLGAPHWSGSRAASTAFWKTSRSSAFSAVKLYFRPPRSFTRRFFPR